LSLGYRERRHYGGSKMRRAKKVQAKRSAWAKHVDEGLKAPQAETVDEWLDAPNRLDLPNVDTNKPRRRMPI
jgi:hypothetical protein